MEAQPPPPQTAPPLSSAAPPPPPSHLSYPDSMDSSPRSRNNDSWDEPFPPSAAAATATTSKLRLMCSYGGHIVPRPNDKSLCYVGGDTRIIVVDRQTSLSDFSTRLSKTFLNGRPFTLKYQLPSEDLDSLISVTTGEDLDNMIDEYDRTTANSLVKPSRIRLFLFPTKPDSSQSIGPILEGSAKSEDWFLNALNGAGLLNRGYSDYASVNFLLGLDEEGGAVNNLDPGSRETDAARPGSFGNGKNLKQGQDVHSVPDSPILETNSSFGSTSSSPSVANLPPIRVHVDDGNGNGNGGGVRVQDQKVAGIEEQFGQMAVGVGLKQDEAFVVLSSPQHPPVTANVSAAAAVGVPISSASEYPNRVISDDERSDHGVPVGHRKPPTSQSQTHSQSQPQSQPMPPQFQQKSTGAVDLPSPDSVSSDSSFTNAMSRPKPVIYQDSDQIQSVTTRVPSNPVDPKLNMPDQYSRVQMQHVPDPGYVLQPQFDQQKQQQQPQQQQQQFMHGTHFIHHTPAGAVPFPTYYPVYPSQQQLQPQHHHQLEQQYQVYYVPAGQAQAAYNVSMQQSNIGESATSIPSSRPQTLPNPSALVPPSAAYNPIRNAPLPKSEMMAGTYRMATAGAPQFVQIPASQHQQQYVAYSQVHHPSQSMAPNSAASANYAYDYGDRAHSQIFYTQPLPPAVPSEYQTMMAGAVLQPEVSAQLPSDIMK